MSLVSPSFLQPPLHSPSIPTQGDPTMPPSLIGVLVGSQRPKGNNQGLLSWLTSVVTPLLPPATTLTVLDYSSLGHIEGPIVPELISTFKDYPDVATQLWSSQVDACDAFIVLTPQYNWSIPGRLKEAFDHLKREWEGKKVIIVAYGGRRGGSKVREHLRGVVLGGALEMKVVGDLGIPLPMTYIAGELRVGKEGKDPEGKEGEVLSFLKEPEEELKILVGEMLKVL